MSHEAPIVRLNFNKIYMLSDLHFGVRSNSLEWLENQMKFFDGFYIPFLDKTKEDGDVFFMLGDWFDNRQLLDINVMNKAVDVIHEISKRMPVYLMTGNHDIYKKNDTDVNSLVVFRFMPNVTVIEKPAVYTNGRSSILVLPWVGDKEEEGMFARANAKKAQYMFAHTDLPGFKYDNGKNIVKGLDVDAIKTYRKVFSGHIHKRQNMDNMIYIGSPYHTKRGDIGNDKAVFVLIPDKDRVEMHQNDMSSVFQRVKLEDLMEWTLGYAHSVLENNYTDIIVPDKYIHLFNLTKFIDLLKDCNYKKIETIGEKVKMDEDFVGIIDGEDVKDILTLMEMSIDDLPNNGLTVDRLKQLNKEYYTKASKTE